MSEEKEKPQQHKEHKIVDKGDGRYISRRFGLQATFTIDLQGRITFYDSIEAKEVKSYHFRDSEPHRVLALAKLLRDAVNQSEKITGKKTSDWIPPKPS